MNLLELALAAALGLVAGTLGGGLGVGTGVLIVPLLVLGFGLSETAAQGTSLLVSLPTALVGSWTHRQQGNLPEWRLSLVAGSFGAVAAFGGALLALRLPRAQLAAVFALYLLAIGIQQGYRAIVEATRPLRRRAGTGTP